MGAIILPQPLNNTWTGTNYFQSQLGIASSISPAQITADQNDYNPTSLSTSNVLRIYSDQDGRNITGLAGGVAGRLLMIENIGSYYINFVYQSSSSSAANRFTTHRSATIAVGPGDMVFLIYDSSGSGSWYIHTYGDNASVNSLTLTGSYPNSPATGDFGYDTATLQFRGATPIGDASVTRQWNTNTSASSAIANTAAKTDFSVTTTIPANSLSVGMCIRYKKAYVYSTTGTPTLDMFEVIGAQTILDTTAITLGSGVSNGVIYLECEGIVTATGASGSIAWKAHMAVTAALGTTTKDDYFYATTGSLDTTGTLVIKSQAQWGTASSSNTIVQEPYVMFV